MFPEPVLLASSSPRRLETLERLGVPVVVFPADVDESAWDHVPVRERVVALARAKAAEAGGRAGVGPRWILGADTLVSVDGEASGKPADVGDARAMLRRLSGRDHVVSSGLAVLDRVTGRVETAVSETVVRFAAMSDTEIEAYLDTGEWEGVAGAYRIQERAALFVERVEGSFSGVVGLPIREFYVILLRCGYPSVG